MLIAACLFENAANIFTCLMKLKIQKSIFNDMGPGLYPKVLNLFLELHFLQWLMALPSVSCHFSLLLTCRSLMSVFAIFALMLWKFASSVSVVFSAYMNPTRDEPEFLPVYLYLMRYQLKPARRFCWDGFNKSQHC